MRPQMKRLHLLDLIEYINALKTPFPEAILPEVTPLHAPPPLPASNPLQVISMASENMFRPLPCRPVDAPFDPDEDEPLLEPSWSHLHIVYEFFLRFVTSASLDCRVARKYVDPVFLTRFLELFNSEDVRERDYLKTTLHRVYVSHRRWLGC